RRRRSGTSATAEPSTRFTARRAARRETRDESGVQFEGSFGSARHWAPSPGRVARVRPQYGLCSVLPESAGTDSADHTAAEDPRAGLGWILVGGARSTGGRILQAELWRRSRGSRSQRGVWSDRRLGARPLHLPGEEVGRRADRPAVRLAHGGGRHCPDRTLCTQRVAGRAAGNAVRTEGGLHSSWHRGRTHLHWHAVRGAQRTARARGPGAGIW